MTTEQLIANLAKQGPNKKFPSPVRILGIWAALVAIYSVAIVVATPLRADLFQRLTHPGFVMELIVAILMIGTSALSASYLALPDGNQKHHIRWLPVIPVLLLIVGLVYGVTTHPSSALVNCVSKDHLACSIKVIVWSIAPTVMIFFTLQKAAPTRFYWAGGMAGLSSGSISYLLLVLIEKNNSAIHFLIFHFLPVVAVTVLAMMIGKRVLGRWLNKGAGY